MKARTTPGVLQAAACAALALPLAAHAHHAMGGSTPGTLLQGLLSGLAHPVIGIDHLMFVLAVGAACYYFGHKAGPVVAFLAGAIAGTVLHVQQVTLAYSEAGVALTLVVLGLLFFRGKSLLKTKAAFAVFAAAGVLHGYAYGESIVGAEPTPLYAYLAGYTAVQFGIAFAGYALARYFDLRKPRSHAIPAVSGALTLAGLAFLLVAL